MFSRAVLCISLSLATATTPLGPITPHFEDWLNRSGYAVDNFARHDLNNTGSYGGKTNSTQEVKHIPVVFFHGNTDGALAIPGEYSSGSSQQIEYFESVGYTSAELYVTTWGNRLVAEAPYQAHNCSTILRLRRFVEAIIKYTGSQKINIISHSMGVTLARKVAKGGPIVEGSGQGCDVGPPLTNSVDVFIGISGANYGMCTCFATAYTCNRENGFSPGLPCEVTNGSLAVCGQNLLDGCVKKTYSRFLFDMNTDDVREGRKVYAFWTKADDVIYVRDMVWGHPSSRIPTMDREFVFNNYTHMQTKEQTAELQYNLLINTSPSIVSFTIFPIFVCLLVVFLK